MSGQGRGCYQVRKDACEEQIKLLRGQVWTGEVSEGQTQEFLLPGRKRVC